MSAFVLKMIAIATMFIDHLGYIIFGKVSFFNYIGRFAFPIFAFQISEGYIHTKNLKKYFLRLFVFGSISQIPYILFASTYRNTIFYPNIFFTLILGLLCITVYDNFKNKASKNFYFLDILLTSSVLFIIMLLGNFLHFDYGFFGVALILLFYVFKNNKLLMNIFYILLVSIHYVINYIQYPTYIYILLYTYTLIPLIFINLYNGKKGKDSKYILYLFYPFHLLFLYLLSFFI